MKVAIKRIVISTLLVGCVATACSDVQSATKKTRINSTPPTSTSVVPPTTVPVLAVPETEPPVVVAEPQVIPMDEPVVQAEVAPPSQPSNSDVLACIRGHESANLANPWAAYNPAGPYYGAYQWLQGSWDSAANAVGRGDLVGRTPMEPYVSAADQDQVTLAYHNMVGDGPWGNMC